jgi:hypothetical protein
MNLILLALWSTVARDKEVLEAHNINNSLLIQCIISILSTKSLIIVCTLDTRARYSDLESSNGALRKKIIVVPSAKDFLLLKACCKKQEVYYR